ncbi:ERI1 exoribonuclease 2 isoform X2 [Engystomops pustulosus]|uniref:ERI1 exoribonuclease 2 isoform X2 n=1 Tax=Engystomops pustulosus TaxID=76066 RepID=UPI003AFA384F
METESRRLLYARPVIRMTTKQLAKQLGLIRRSSKLSLNAKDSSSPKSKQFFDYLIVIDFESTCWKDTKHYGQEIIEFPAVLLNTSSGVIESEFHTYVQPQEHPILSDFCTELTGIKQQQVDAGVPLKICLSQFSTWIQKLQKERAIVFPGLLPTHACAEQKMCGFVTWSDWDLGVCLLYECKRKQLRKPDILNSWIDLRLAYKLFYNRKPQGLNGALQDVGIEFSGREHSGLDDSRNTARLAWRMICDGCVMKITKSLDKVPPNSSARPGPSVTAQSHNPGQSNVRHASTVVKEDGQDSRSSLTSDKTKDPRPQQPHSINNQYTMAVTKCLKGSKTHQTLINGLSTTLGNDNKYRFPPRRSLGPMPNVKQIGAITSTPLDHSPHGGAHVLLSTTVLTVNDVSALDMDSSSDLSILADWEEAAVIEDSQQDKHESPAEELDLLAADSPSSAVLMLKNNMENRKSMNSTANFHTKSVVYKSPDTTIYNVNLKKPVSHGSTFKLPSALGNRSSAPAVSTEQKSKSSTLLDYFPKRKLSSVSFYSPPKKLPFAIHEDLGNRSLPVTTGVSRNVLKSSVNVTRTFGGTKSNRITAPMCHCGRRAKKLTVSNPGPNQGRVFYSCSVRKRNDDRGKGCNYFKWEEALLKEKSADMSALLSTSGLCTTFNKSLISTGSSKPLIKLRPSMRT